MQKGAKSHDILNLLLLSVSLPLYSLPTAASAN